MLQFYKTLMPLRSLINLKFPMNQTLNKYAATRNAVEEDEQFRQNKLVSF
jgi:hypothetical protein